MKQKIQILFIVGVLLVCVLPIVRFNRTGTVSERENRALASRPYLLVENRVNKNIFSEYSNYFNDRFGGRNRLIALHTYMQHQVLRGALYNEKAIRGKAGWWFYLSSGDGDNLSDFTKTNLLSEEALEQFRTNVENTVAWCERQGIPCIFLVGPNKHSVYPEYYPIRRPEGKTRADQLMGVLEDVGVPSVFPRDSIIAAKAGSEVPLYYETDTHWNPLGAFVAYEQLLPVLQVLFPERDFPVIEYDSRIEYSTTAGDILPMLAIAESRSTQPHVFPKDYEQEELYTYLKNEGVRVHTKSAVAPDLRALVFRDSFFSALEPFVSPLFSEVEYVWRQFREEDKEYVLQYKPDIVIFESVERNCLSIVAGIQ